MTLIPLTIPYIPLLELKPAEMLALQELPEKVKDALFPGFRLRRWVASDTLRRSIERLVQANGTRPALLELAEESVPVESRKDVHEELDRLRDPAGGYLNWVNFLRLPEQLHFVPVAQLGSPLQLLPQLKLLQPLGRGVSLRLTRDLFAVLESIVKSIGGVEPNGDGFLLILDFGTIRAATVAQDAEWGAAAASYIRTKLPRIQISVSGSSFPSSFVGLDGQNIHERALFEQASSRTDAAIIFSDHGSARVESQIGGGGMPAPRVDYAAPRKWAFFRDDSGGNRLACYEKQARACIASEYWDSNLKIWGCQMIERTALGDENALVTPARGTAVRINLHLHQQLFFDDKEGLYDTDESWSD